MSQGESPAVARRRVRLALRRAREEKGLTQGEVASALDWSLSKVQRIESGEVSVSSTDLRALLAYLDLSDAHMVTHLMDDARTSRRQRWFTDPRYREFLTSGTQQLLQFESEATAIRSFALTLVPGILQTAEFAQVALKLGPAGLLSEDTAKVRHEVRMNRRQIFERKEPPQYKLVLDESVLWREMGGARVTAEQLKEMLRFMREPNVSVRVIPFAQAAAVALLGPFTLFSLENEEEDAVLYREGYDYDEVVQTPAEVEHHRLIFEDLWGRSLNDAASARLIEARAATMLASLDRHPYPS
jgi:transcriptional regulator with XRE-family HTH domain